MSRPLVIVEPKVHRRLKLIDALRDLHSLQPLPAIDGALRHIRVHRPSIVLIGVGWHTEPALRLARQIRTDGSTPAMVGLMDWDGHLSRPSDSAQACGAVGVFSGPPTPTELADFVAALSPEEVVLRGTVQARGWTRFLKR